MATNIRVALEVDAKKYISDLKNADGATQAFAKSAETSSNNVTTALGKIGNASDSVANKANLLITTLAGVGAASFVQSILQSASATKDLADAFGLSLTSALELEQGFAKAGRSTDNMNQALASLFNSASSAQDGNVGLQNSFRTLGVSMKDLQNQGAKEVITTIAQAMTDGTLTSDKLNAAYDILGKTAKGLPFNDLAQGLADASGKMGEQAGAVNSLDTTMKTLEASAKAVKNEFMLLIKPVADAFNEFTQSGGNAKVVAEAIAGAIALIGGIAAVRGITTVVEAVSSLTKVLGLTSATATVAAGATGAYVTSQAALTAATIASTAGLTRVSTAQVALNVATLELAALQQSATATALELTAAETALASAQSRLAIITEASALAQAQLSASSATATVATGGLAVATTGLAGAFAGLMIAVAPWVAAIAAIGTLYLLYKQNSDEAKTSTDAMLGALDDSSFSQAIMNAKDLAEAVKDAGNNANKTEETFKRLGIAASNLGGGRGKAPSGTPIGGGLDIAVANKPTLNQQAGAEQALKNQLDILTLSTAQVRARAAEQAQMLKDGIVLTAEQKSLSDAQWAFANKQGQELLRINAQIAQLRATAENDKEGSGKYAGQLKLLEQQREAIKAQKDETSSLAYSIALVEKARQADLEQLKKAFELQQKIQEAQSNAQQSIIGQKQDIAFNFSKIGKSDLEKQMMDIGEANRKAGLEAARAFASAFEDNGDGLTPERAKQLADGLEAIRKGYDEIGKAQLDSFKASLTFDAGWQEAFANYKQSSYDSAQSAKQSFETFTGGLEDAFVKFVQTGKLSFKDLINSMIADFAKLQAKKALSGLMDMGGGSGIGSLFGGIGKLFGFADGGNPPMGKASIVGERGAELLIPRNASTIVPLEGLGGGGSSNVTYNINATDAQSFKQMLAREPEFLFAVTESGRRNMPTRSRR